MGSLVGLVENISRNFSDFGFEGIILLDSQGNTLYEKRWIEDYPRDIYSNTKSFTSAAIGMTVYNNLLSLETRVVDVLGKFYKDG